MDSDSTLSPLVVVLASIVLGAAIYVLISLFGGDDKKNEQEESTASKKPTATKPKQPPAKSAESSKKKVPTTKGKKIDLAAHPCLAADIKGHTAPVLDIGFDASGDYLVSCSEDRTIRVWYSRDFSEKEHKYHRINVELDHATNVCFSPDSRALVTSLNDLNGVRVFKLNRKKDGSIQGSSVALDIPKKHDTPILNVAIASNGRYIMTVSADNKLILWTPKGDLLEVLDAKQVTTNYAGISPDGRFVACSGFTGDVKLWEVNFAKSGDTYQAAPRVMELKGHTSSVYNFSFSADSHRMATVSKDGHFKVWDIDVKYELKQDPILLADVNHCADYPSSQPMLASLSPDGTTVAVASDGRIVLYRADGTAHHDLGVVHTADITALQWHPTSAIVCSASSDKRIVAWHNITGMQVKVEQIRERLRSTRAETVRERLQEQLQELEKRCATISEGL